MSIAARNVRPNRIQAPVNASSPVKVTHLELRVTQSAGSAMHPTTSLIAAVAGVDPGGPLGRASRVAGLGGLPDDRAGPCTIVLPPRLASVEAGVTAGPSLATKGVSRTRPRATPAATPTAFCMAPGATTEAAARASSTATSRLKCDCGVGVPDSRRAPT